MGSTTYVGSTMAAKVVSKPGHENLLNTKLFSFPTLIGKLLYCSNCTRPDIIAVGKCQSSQQVHVQLHSTTLGPCKTCPTVPQRHTLLLPYVQWEHLSRGNHVARLVLRRWRKHTHKDRIPKHDVRRTCGMGEQAPIYGRYINCGGRVHGNLCFSARSDLPPATSC